MLTAFMKRCRGRTKPCGEALGGAISSAAFLRGLITVAAVSVLPGCANEARVVAQESAGWRVGWVRQIVEEKDLHSVHYPKCDSTITSEGAPDRRFAIVTYPTYIGSRVRRIFVFELSRALDVRVGDSVRVNVLNCELAISHGR